jgi:hypothetical protein
VLSMERLNIIRFVPIIVAIIYLATGDYASFMRHIQTIA